MTSGRCVLALHRVVDARTSAHDVTWASFHALLDALPAGATSTVLTEGAAAAGRVVLTFDDATAEHLRVAEELAERGIAAVFFVPTSKIGGRGHLDAEQIVRLVALGHVLGAHSHSHRPLARLESADLRREVEVSRDTLAALAGTEIRSFAPPGGIFHPLLPEELARAGFESSRSMRWGVYIGGSDRWRIPVIPVTELTVRRGWVVQALREFRLPLAMRLLRTGRRVLPTRVATAARDALLVPAGALR
jgi:peptidoglycan/xylan/chitin deacetylase (PgdA/CDA1 family)